MPLFDWIRSDLHSLNLDWIISKIKTVEESEQGAVDAAADANASKTAAAASKTAAAASATAASGSATLAAVSAQQAQNLVDQLDTTIAQDVTDWLDEHITPTTPAVDDTLTVSGAAADAAVTGDKITELKTAIDTFNNYGLILNAPVGKTLFDTIAPYGSSALATTRRWFINQIFDTGTYLDKINFSYSKATSVQRDVYIEVWEKTGNTLTKVKTVSADITQPTTVYENAIETVTINYTALNPCMVCIVTTGGSSSVLYTTESEQHNRVLVSTDVSLDTDTLLYSSLASFTAVYILPSVKLYYAVSTAKVVTIGEGMQYAEIQDALEAITDDTADNPYTFWVMPKGTPYQRFSTLRRLTDNYITSGRMRHISIIGMDKAHCIIQSDSGDYKEPCAELLINGIVSNISFKMTNIAQTPTAEKGGYCIHMDFEPNPAAVCNMTIENCDFEDASGPCLGIGLRQNMKITIRNCRIHTTLAASYAPHTGYRNLVNYGCVYAHTNSGATTQNQRIVIENCVGICEEGNYSLELAHAGSYDQSTADFKYTLLNNVFWNINRNLPAYYIDSDLTPMPYNFGNNNA